jgi:hypothetical protein
MNAWKRIWGRRGKDGFAIPVAIFVMLVLSLLALSGMYITQSNAAGNLGIRRSHTAFNAANAGAVHVLGTWDRWTYGVMKPGDSHDTGWEWLPDGSSYRADVRRVDDGSDPNELLYRLRTIGRPGSGLTAQRVIVTMASAKKAAALCCEAAMKTRGPLQIQGTGLRVKVSGFDTDPTAWSGHCSSSSGDLPGIMTPEDDDITTHGGPRIEGSPAPVQEDGSIVDEDFTQFGNVSYWELASSADKVYVGDQHFTTLQPVVVGGQCVRTSPTNWGDPLNPAGACWRYLPIIHVAGDMFVAGSAYGQGVLLVDGDLIVTGTLSFYGVVIVMGEADFRGTTDIHGGLLARNGVSGELTGNLRGTTSLQYSSCAAARALFQATVPRPLAGRHWFEVLE